MAKKKKNEMAPKVLSQIYFYTFVAIIAVKYFVSTN